NPGLMPNPVIDFTNPNGYGTLTFAPVLHGNTAVSGPVTITVTVNDNQGLDNIITRTSTIAINPVNDPPTLDNLNPVTLSEDAPTQTVDLSGITAGPANETGQPLTVSVLSSNPAIIPFPTIAYTSAASIGTLTFTPLGNRNTEASGPVTLTVTVDDGQGTNNNVIRTFAV